MSHTPGPWTTDSRPEATVEIAVVESAAFDAIEVYAGRSATSVEEHVGTARLIAAAPDLLEALRQARHLVAAAAVTSHFLDGFEIGADGLPRIRKVPDTDSDLLLQMADAAIAKAEGHDEAHTATTSTKCTTEADQ